MLNGFFGVVRTTVFRALYLQLGRVTAFTIEDMLTYTWVLEGMFAAVWASWVWEFAESVRSGDFAIELLRPGDPYLRGAAFDLGRSLNVIATRMVPMLLLAAVALPL